MATPPIQLIYSGQGAFLARPASIPICEANFGPGEVVTVAQIEERSRKSHDHFFATISEMWATRPEHLEHRFPTPDAWRKAALIATGHCDTRTVVCATKAEADRMVALAAHLDPESIAVPRGTVVTVYTAHSQSLRAMGKEAFQKSKDDCLTWAAAQLGINDGQGGAGAKNARAEAA